jgi:hypothetical protein
MTAIPARKMLETLLKAKADLLPKEVEAFENMWDSVHRFGKLSVKQTAWIEETFYKVCRKVEAPATPGKVGVFKSPSVERELQIKTFEGFKKACPEASPEALNRVKTFFSSGGGMIKVSPS